ncbi:SAM domain-containing protein SAMSN-1 [Protopterus annectens]|uniref:SAM domain-containing protein SAMSN-1 n=1 Tax=Protopterus annectens TaxID=7888 RepID=UPI001CF9D1D7|nr:SAM domain-containing protein SAMSN-1 [Protopterus annectens]
MLKRKPSNVSDKEKSQKPKRASSFGSFDRFRHHSSSTKPSDSTDDGNVEECTDQGLCKEGTSSTSLGKKMKSAISLTMKKKTCKKYIKTLSEEMANNQDGDAGPQRDSDGAEGTHGEKVSLKNSDSMESLNSGQSSCSGITSCSEGTSNRDSFRLDEDVPYAGPFCGRAKVHTDFIPSPYDTDSLKLKKGDIIDVICKPPMGTWTGLLNNKVGNFKFIYVDVMSEEDALPKRIQPQRRSKRPKPKDLDELLKRIELEEYSSTLLLNGYQTLEDLKDLTESHLIELNVTNAEHRKKMLAAADHLLDYENDRAFEDDNEEAKTKSLTTKCDQLQLEDECPRDSGCYITVETSDNGKEDMDSEILVAEIQQISIT